MLKTTGVKSIDSVRDIVVELFQNKKQLKKSDIVNACQERLNCAPAANIYSKVMQELATSRGSVWTFKTE